MQKDKKIPTYYCGDFGYNSRSLAPVNLQTKEVQMQELVKSIISP